MQCHKCTCIWLRKKWVQTHQQYSEYAHQHITLSGCIFVCALFIEISRVYGKSCSTSRQRLRFSVLAAENTRKINELHSTMQNASPATFLWVSIAPSHAAGARAHTLITRRATVFLSGGRAAETWLWSFIRKHSSRAVCASVRIYPRWSAKNAFSAQYVVIKRSPHIFLVFSAHVRKKLFVFQKGLKNLLNVVRLDYSKPWELTREKKCGYSCKLTLTVILKFWWNNKHN